MNRTVKLAKQGVMMVLVAVVAAFVGAQVTVLQMKQVHVEGRGKVVNGIVFVDDKTKPCPNPANC
jgi:hypothetical protein